MNKILNSLNHGEFFLALIMCLLSLAGYSNNPKPRSGFAMAYDEGNGKIVLFGGQDSTGNNLGDTWQWTQAHGWVELSGIDAPKARINSSVAYVSQLGGIVLFGGLSDEGCENDLWIFKDGKWNLLESKNSPFPRQLATMAYNEAENKLILYGGKDDENNRLSEAWSYENRSWRKLPDGPSARSSHAMAYLPTNQSIIVYGGYDGQSLGDFWQLKDDKWLNRKDISGPPRLHCTLTFNTKTKKVMLFGGFGQNGRTNELWVLNSQEWELKEIDSSPSPRAEHEGVYVPDEGLYVFGGVIGVDPRTRIRANDFWVFDDSRWELIK